MFATRGWWLLVALWISVPVASPFLEAAEAGICDTALGRVAGKIGRKIAMPFRSSDPLADVLTQIPHESLKKILMPHLITDASKLPRDRSWPVLGALRRAYYKWTLRQFGRSYDAIADLLTRASTAELQTARQLGFGEAGKLISESKDLAKTIVNLTQGLSEKNALVVLKHYFGDGEREPRHPIDFLARLRALGAVGTSKADFEAISQKMEGKMGKGLSDEGRLDAFKEGVAETIGTRIPGTARGIRQLDDLTALMEPGISGSIFENWANKYIYHEGARALGRFQLKFKDVKGKATFHNSSLSSDNMIDAGDRFDLVEFKHLRTSQDFGEREIEQMENYRELKRIGHLLKRPGSRKEEDARPLGKVRYLFSGQDAAEKNRPKIREILKDDAIITYIDHETGRVVELN